MRYYSEISKKDFLSKVKELMENDEYPYETSKSIEKDLDKVDFSWENYTTFNSTQGFCNYPFGYKELKPGMHLFFTAAGGDWEIPICFVYYWGDGELRAYIPKDGNLWNKKEKCAYGSENDFDEAASYADGEDNQNKIIEKEYSEEKLYADILTRIISR